MITSASNEKVKRVAKLIKSASVRRDEGAFVVEGERICSEIPDDRYIEGLVSESFYNKHVSMHAHGSGDGDCANTRFEVKPGRGDECLVNGMTFSIVSDSVYKKVSDTVSGQGIIGIVKTLKTSAREYVCEHTKDLRLLILENIQDPGNLGTMIRTAEAAGFDAIITDRTTVDAYNPKVIRSTMGGIFRFPIMSVENLGEFLLDLRSQGMKLYAAALDGSVDYRECKYDSRVGIIIGNEGNGLTQETIEAAGNAVRIPMSGQAESLNAAVAAAILMYKVVE